MWHTGSIHKTSNCQTEEDTLIKQECKVHWKQVCRIYLHAKLGLWGECQWFWNSFLIFPIYRQSFQVVLPPQNPNPRTPRLTEWFYEHENRANRIFGRYSQRILTLSSWNRSWSRVSRHHKTKQHIIGASKRLPASSSSLSCQFLYICSHFACLTSNVQTTLNLHMYIKVN